MTTEERKEYETELQFLMDQELIHKLSGTGGWQMYTISDFGKDLLKECIIKKLQE